MSPNPSSKIANGVPFNSNYRHSSSFTQQDAKLDLANDEVNQNNASAFSMNETGNIPNGGYGWVVVFASFMCNMTVDGICYSFGIFLPYFMHSFDANKSTTALAGSLQSGCYLTAGNSVSNCNILTVSVNEHKVFLSVD